MALPTAPNQPPPAPQRPTPGVGATPATHQPGAPTSQAPTPGVGPYQPRAGGMQPSMTGVRQTPETEGAEPILFEDIEPGLLARVHPSSFAAGITDAGKRALEAGQRVREDALHLRANADEDVWQETGTSAPPTDQPSSSRPQTAPARPNEPGLQGEQTAAGQAFPPQQHATGAQAQAQRPAPQPGAHK